MRPQSLQNCRQILFRHHSLLWNSNSATSIDSRPPTELLVRSTSLSALIDRVMTPIADGWSNPPAVAEPCMRFGIRLRADIASAGDVSS
jgi:hypothetical protein